MSGATAQELAVRTAIVTVADTGTLLQKVDSPGRLYSPITKAQLKLDMGGISIWDGGSSNVMLDTLILDAEILT